MCPLHLTHQLVFYMSSSCYYCMQFTFLFSLLWSIYNDDFIFASEQNGVFLVTEKNKM